VPGTFIVLISASLYTAISRSSSYQITCFEVPLAIRWKLAVDHLEELEMVSLAAEEALRFLIRHDFPVLLKEITQLRPELV
jgi:hypothetical protein